MDNRRMVTLSDVTTIIGDGLHGTPIYNDKGDYFFINGNNLNEGIIEIKKETKRVGEKEYQKYIKPLSDKTILLSINGTIGNLALYNNEKCMLGKSACFININETCDRLYLYYSLKSADFQYYIREIATGTTIPNVPLKGLRQYPLLLPPLPEQRAIAGVLSSLDDKIDLLHRQNRTLEAMAETLFRQWFVEPCRDGLPEGCEEVDVSFYADHEKISIHPNKMPETLFSHYSIPAFDSDKKPVQELGEKIKSNKYVVSGECILFSKLNPHKDKRIWLLPFMVNDNSVCSTEFQVVKPKNSKALFFIYGWLNHQENFNEISSGIGGTSGSHQRINPRTIFEFRCPHISDDRLEKYNEIITPVFTKTIVNHSQIKNLESTRDTLLPKLMCGEVRVKL